MIQTAFMRNCSRPTIQIIKLKQRQSKQQFNCYLLSVHTPCVKMSFTDFFKRIGVVTSQSSNAVSILLWIFSQFDLCLRTYFKPFYFISQKYCMILLNASNDITETN